MSTIPNIQPMGDNILLQLMEETEQVKGGIIIPDTAKEKPQTAMVCAVGPGKIDKNGNRILPEVKVGNKVVFRKYSGTEIKIEGEKYTISPENDILAIIS